MSAQSPFLSDEEILEIVEPLVQPAAIMRWFKNNGFPDVKKRPNGMPLIARAYFDAVTVSAAAKASTENRAENSAQPNVEAFRERYGKGSKVRLVR